MTGGVFALQLVGLRANHITLTSSPILKHALHICRVTANKPRFHHPLYNCNRNNSCILALYIIHYYLPLLALPASQNLHCGSETALSCSFRALGCPKARAFREVQGLEGTGLGHKSGKRQVATPDGSPTWRVWGAVRISGLNPVITVQILSLDQWGLGFRGLRVQGLGSYYVLR